MPKPRYWSPTRRRPRKPKNLDWLRRNEFDLSKKQREILWINDAIESSNGWCIVNAPGCQRLAVTAHWEEDWPPPSRILACCDPCHAWLHRTPIAANDNDPDQYALGLLKSDEEEQQASDKLLEAFDKEFGQ